MNYMSGSPRSLSAAASSSESETAHLVARARVMMVISALTTILAIAAVVVVIGYRVFNTRVGGPISESTLLLPKGARVISTLATATAVTVTLEVGGVTEARIYDRKTLQQTGRIHFATEQP